MSTQEETKQATIPGSCPWKNRDNSETIPCPALVSFYNNGLLNPDGEGNVKLEDVDRVLTEVGATTTIRQILESRADMSDGVKDGKFNLFKLRKPADAKKADKEGDADHTGSTGIRDPEFAPEMIDEALLDFSEGDRMYSKHFAAAANKAREKDPGFSGTVIQTLEFAALLEVFGRLDEDNKRYLTKDDVSGLWIDGKFPDGWSPRGPNEIGANELGAGMTNIAIRRLLKLIGK